MFKLNFRFHIFNNNEKSLIFCSTSGQRRDFTVYKMKKKEVFSASHTYRAKLSRCCRQIIDQRKTFSSICYIWPAWKLTRFVGTTDSCDIFPNAPKGGIISDRGIINDMKNAILLQRIDFLRGSSSSHTINSVNYVFQRRRISRSIVKLCSVSRVILAGSLKEIADQKYRGVNI